MHAHPGQHGRRRRAGAQRGHPGGHALRLRRGWKVTGIQRGYHGLISGDPDGLVDLTRDKVRGIAHLGGTILGTVNKGHPFEFLVTRDGKTVTTDISDEIMRRFREVKAETPSSPSAATAPSASPAASRQKGMPIVGVPKTIDNDLSCTQATFGFDTAVTVATEAIDRLHTTAESHERIMVVEVMGRYAGWIAMHAGVAGNAHVILMPEIPYDIDKVVAHIKRRYAGGRRYCIVVVAEGAKPKRRRHQHHRHRAGPRGPPGRPGREDRHLPR